MREFDTELMNSHPGDSGPGGNYPQEPIYEYGCEPQDMRSWLKSALASVVLWASDEILKEKRWKNLPAGPFCDGERYARYGIEKDFIALAEQIAE